MPGFLTNDAAASVFSPAIFHGPPARPETLWHYTTSWKARRIIEEGILRPYPQYGGTTPLLWLSRNHVWEPVACRPFTLSTWEWRGHRVPKSFTFEGMQAYGTRLVRFAVHESLAPYSHFEAFRMAGVTAAISDMLLYVGRNLGGRAEDWRATMESIPAADWLSIELWRTDHWEEVAV